MGKLLDPLADKLTQIAVVLSLAIRHKEVIPLLVICVLKELAQAAGGVFLLRRGEQIRGAKWYGKVSTFVFYGVMALILFVPMPQGVFIRPNYLGGCFDAVCLLQLCQGVFHHTKGSSVRTGYLL